MGDMRSQLAGVVRCLGPFLLLALPLVLAACDPNDPQNTFTANGHVARRARGERGARAGGRPGSDAAVPLVARRPRALDFSD